jgi:hypothetical protein
MSVHAYIMMDALLICPSTEETSSSLKIWKDPSNVRSNTTQIRRTSYPTYRIRDSSKSTPGSDRVDNKRGGTNMNDILSPYAILAMMGLSDRKRKSRLRTE